MDLPDDLTGFIGRFNIQSWLIQELNFSFASQRICIDEMETGNRNLTI